MRTRVGSSPTAYCLTACCLSTRYSHRLDDVVVAGAAADVALEPAANLGLGRLRVLAQEIDDAHHHAGRAEPALQPVRLLEGGLNGVQISAFRQPLDGCDLGAVGLDGEHVARFDRVAVEMHDAGAALAGIATDVRAGEAQVLAQE